MTTQNRAIPVSLRPQATPASSIAATYEFTGPRAELFKEALREYPTARRDDFALMRRHLDPQSGDYVLGFGEGSGHFCNEIARSVGARGRYVITEPSPELFSNVPQAVLDLPQVFTQITPVEDVDLPTESMDKALALQTRDAHLLYHASLIYYRAGDTAKGKDCLRLAAEANPKFTEFHVHR